MRTKIYHDPASGLTAWINSSLPLANAGKAFLEIEDGDSYSTYYRPDEIVEENIAGLGLRTAANVQARLLEKVPDAAAILANVTAAGLTNAALQWEPLRQPPGSQEIFESAEHRAFAIENGIELHSKKTGAVQVFGDHENLPSGENVSIWKMNLRRSQSKL